MLLPVLRYPDLISADTAVYRASAHGERQDNGLWSGYFVFAPVDGGRSAITGRETTQSSFEMLAYWARGITPVYLEGALERALALQPEARLERQLADMERLEADTAAEADKLERAAAIARAETQLAAKKRAEAERALAMLRAEAAEPATTEAEADPTGG